MNLAGIIAWIQSVFGDDVPVILGYQNAPIPEGPFARVSFVTLAAGADKIVRTSRDSDGVRYHIERSDIAQLLENLALAEHSPATGREVPAVIDRSAIRGPSFFKDSHFRPRFMTEYRFRVPMYYEATGPEVARIQGSGEVSDIDAEFEATFDET